MNILAEHPWLWHILAYPLYQIIGTARHELSHAIFGMFQGASVNTITIFPHWRSPRGDQRFLPKQTYRFHWGYVDFDSGTAYLGWKTYLAPYAIGTLLAVLGAILLPNMVHRYHIWWSTFIICNVSTFIDVVYNVGKWLIYHRGDWEEVFPHDD